jgi:hypothetical protein
MKSPTSVGMQVDSAMAILAKGNQILRYIFTQRTSLADVVDVEKV